ncbi:MAG: hypothetical protein SA339_08285 [Methanomassiliicoccus sp.]|nr:hypothetical protein [Methanomassiliicoccus sp.]
MKAGNQPQSVLPFPTIQTAQESSTFLRYMQVLAAMSHDDFNFDATKAMIMTSHIWIAESKSEQELNHRCTMSTSFIMSVLAPLVLGNEEKHPEWRRLFDEIEDMMNACNIVTVGSDQAGVNDSREMKVFGYVSSRENKEEKASLSEVKNSELVCNIQDYAVALDAQKENGYRSINCTARQLYYKVMKLAYLTSYIKPEEIVNIIAERPRAEKMLSEEEKLRQRRGDGRSF